MDLRRGDHICFIYSTPAERADTVAAFLADGLRHRQRCWYVASGDETPSIRVALQRHQVDVAAETRRGALRLIEGEGTYHVRGAFSPAHSIKVFNDAIDRACSEGFTGFRAAADMSWALHLSDGPSQLIVYEALLKALFSSCPAIGLCLYDRRLMPLDVIDGALALHPKIRARAGYRDNEFYEPDRVSLTAVAPQRVLSKLEKLEHADD